MTQGRLFAVVGPSGAGKDTLMRAAKHARPDLHLVRRVITRPQTGGEDFEQVSEAEFARRLAAGDFVLHWRAHGFRYGIPAVVHDVLAEGRDVLFNCSRAALPEVRDTFPDIKVIHITVRPEILARRLAARGRESADQIASRLERANLALPQGLDVTEIDNSGSLEASTAAFLAALQRPSG